MAGAGWYPDPAGSSHERFWDGFRWGAETRPPLPRRDVSEPPPPARALESTRATFTWRLWHVIAAAVVALVVGLAIGGGSGSHQAAVDASVTGSTTPIETTLGLPPSLPTRKPMPAPTAAAPAPAPQPTIIYTANGSGSKSTETFNVPSGNWDLRWHYDCSGFVFHTGNFQVFSHRNGSLSGDIVNQLGPGRSDVEHFHDGHGSFFLQINSECDWNVVVVTSP